MVHAKLSCYYDSSNMKPINIVDVPTLYNGMTILFFSGKIGAALKREITEAAYIYHPHERMHHVIAIECNAAIDNSCTWRCSAGNQRLLDHPHICTTLQELADRHLPCAMEIE